MAAFNWCEVGQHDQCVREYQRWMVDTKTNKVVWLDNTVTCECPKRGCKCYVKRADRTTTRRRRKK